MDKKKLIYIISGVAAVMVVLIIIIAIVSSLSKKTLSYSKIEDTLKNSAISYFKDNETALPNNEGGSTTVDASTLSNGGYMKELSLLTKEGISCSGKVIVTKNKDQYLYSPILSCGDEFQTKKFIDVVLKDNPVITSGDGLYQDGDSYFFKGEEIYNYVKLDNSLWRILDIDSEGYARLIYVGKNTEDKYIWDDRYNIEEDDYVGINDYSVSRMRQILLDFDSNGQYITKATKSNLAYKTWCVGKRSSTNTSLNNDEECTEKLEGQLFGLPYVSDYARVSIDKNCNTIDDESCGNYNYLMASSLSSWTLTAQKEKTHKVYTVSGNGYSISNAANEKYIRPTVYMSNNAIYSSGDGTSQSPYEIR